MKKLIRKGIPDCFRGYVWLSLANIEYYKQNSGISYRKMVEMNNNKTYENYTAAEKEILKDLNRTFPNNTFFREKLGLGQRSMFNVLSCFSRFSTETGYVQGMGFLSACFLNFMDEESAFWMLISIMDKYHLKGFYKQGFPELPVSMYKFMSLVKKIIPRIFETFKSKNIFASIFASQWFLTLFFVNLKFEFVVRILDCFFMEGMRVIYRVGLALLKLNEEKITSNKQLDEIMNIMKKLDDGITIDMLFKTAFENIKFSEKMMQVLT